ncbi:PREDICTED: annexin A3 isoform X1 [Myotis brandtii]|uniref:annexin A3 isoform X1 n=1 Tax=Myotis brandtii TaxID=109478 RepID=UPI0007041237|nr:PREDICTED: annexin A3 isoform X1 [Myotis brandtii]XP_014400238.1 PREDICTED: annexin A3 isoform X1 [Myotis brandtii]
MASLWVGHRGTVRDYPGFSPSVDAEAIRKAIRGIGTDEKTLISILTERSNAQRQLIVKEYQAAYEKKLKDDLKSDLSGHFEHLMVALVTPPAVFDAKQLKKSMKGAGTDEDALIEILTTRTSRQMKEISQAYYTVYKKSLGDDISSETSGDFRKALLTLADGRRDESLKVDEQLAKKDAQILYNAGEKKWGTDEDKFTEILCLRSFPQLKRTFDEYRNISQKDIEDSIKGELSGHFEDLLLAIAPLVRSGELMSEGALPWREPLIHLQMLIIVSGVHCARNIPAFLAERLHRALKGAGTDEFTLNRIMVSRSEIDLLDIRAEFKKRCGYSLYSAIKSDTSGDYEATLLKLCGGDD